MSISKIQYSLSKYLFTRSLRQMDGKNYTSTCFLNDIVMMQSIHCNCGYYGLIRFFVYFGESMLINYVDFPELRLRNFTKFSSN